MKGLTRRQREILDYIQHFITSHQFSPSYREIMAHFGFSSLGSVYKHINVLKRKGLITTEKNCSRSININNKPLIENNEDTIELPFLGLISAGIPIETFPHTENIAILSAFVPNPNQSYLLKVRGDSLSEEYIQDTDLLIIEARQIAQPGETTILLIRNQETVIKRYYPQGPYVRLEPANLNFTPLIIKTEEVSIQGIVVGLLRQYL